MFGWLYHRYLTTKGSNHHFGVAQIRHFQPQSHSKIHIPSPYSVVHSFPYGSQESPTGRRFPKMPSPPFESSWIIHFRLFFPMEIDHPYPVHAAHPPGQLHLTGLLQRPHGSRPQGSLPLRLWAQKRGPRDSTWQVLPEDMGKTPKVTLW